MFDGTLHHFVAPCHMVGDVYGIGADLQHGQNVRTGRIADHHELSARQSEFLHKPGIAFLILFAHYFDMFEVVTQSRSLQFMLLVEEIAFGGQYDSVFRGEVFERLFDSVEQADRNTHERSTQFENFTGGLSGELLFAEL